MLTVLPTQADTRDEVRQERVSARREYVLEADDADAEQSQEDQEAEPAGVFRKNNMRLCLMLACLQVRADTRGEVRQERVCK